MVTSDDGDDDNDSDDNADNSNYDGIHQELSCYSIIRCIICIGDRCSTGYTRHRCGCSCGHPSQRRWVLLYIHYLQPCLNHHHICIPSLSSHHHISVIHVFPLTMIISVYGRSKVTGVGVRCLVGIDRGPWWVGGWCVDDDGDCDGYDDDGGDCGGDDSDDSDDSDDNDNFFSDALIVGAEKLVYDHGCTAIAVVVRLPYHCSYELCHYESSIAYDWWIDEWHTCSLSVGSIPWRRRMRWRPPPRYVLLLLPIDAWWSSWWWLYARWGQVFCSWLVLRLSQWRGGRWHRWSWGNR